MPTAILGRTGLKVNKNAFGALPVQRIPLADAVQVLRAAADAGIDFFDTARGYTDSEEKLGAAFGGRWGNIVLATKTPSRTVEGFWKDLDTSLALLKKDYIDIYQFHNPAVLPRPGDGTGLYEAMLEAKEKGLIRHIGVTNHRLDVATEAVESGLYETLQFPFSYLSTQPDLDLVQLCEEKNVGFIAMKALSGGLINDVSAALAYMDLYPNVVPIWGIQHMQDMEKLAAAMAQPTGLTDAHKAHIEQDRAELQGEFCRACGYCMPCPAGIEINLCARILPFMRRSPTDMTTPEYQAKLKKVEDCIECGQCSSQCPYGLDTPALLKKSYAGYRQVLAEKGISL